MNELAFSEYQLLKKIGQGGICSVWQAKQPPAQRDIALKILHSGQDSALTALRREYRFLKFHCHPGIVRAFDYIEQFDSAAIAMELLPGGTLEKECAKLSQEKLKGAIVGILEIANFINHCGFIYGDYKPQNFMLDEKEDLRLIDFNLIRPSGDTSPIKSGTLGYIAPEVLTGRGTTRASDIYALGATIYELATGRLPYDITDNKSAVQIITEETIRPPVTGWDSLDNVLQEMLSADPTVRPTDYFEISQRLGLPEKLKAKIKLNAGYYLNAGLLPFAQQLCDEVMHRKISSKPLAIVANDKFEHGTVFDQVAALLSLDAHGRQLSITRDRSADSWTESVNYGWQSGKDGRIDKTAGNAKPETIHLIDCRNNLTPDIIKAASSLCGDNDHHKSIVCLFGFAIYDDTFGDSLEYFFLKDLPARARIYSEHFLKRYNLDEDWLKTLESLAGDQPEIWHDYLACLIEADKLEYGSGGWEATGDLDSSHVPAKIEEHYIEAAAALTHEDRQVLEIVAVLGNLNVHDQILTQFGHAPTEMAETLGRLERSGWLKLQDGEYNFANESRSLTVYRHIDKNRRRQLHCQAAEYLTAYNSGDIEALARHSAGAGDYSNATRYFLQAAQKSFGSFDYKKARAFITGAEDSLARLGENQRSGAMAIETFVMAGDIAKALAEYAEAEKKYRTAVDIAEKTDSGSVLAGAYKCLADIYRILQKSTESIEYSRKALALYDEQSDLANQAGCLNNIGLALWTAGDFKGALSNFDRALKINMEISDYGEQAKIYNNLGIIYDQTGRGSEVIGNFEKALACAEKLADLRLQTKIYDNIGYFYLNSGNPRRALEYFKKDLELATRIGLDEDRINILSNMGLAYHKIGSIIQSAEVHQQALEISRALGHRLLEAQTCHHLARDCMAMGNYALAVQMLQQAGEIGSHLAGGEMAMEILLTEAELAYAMNELEGCRNLVAKFDEPDNITFIQSLRAEYMKVLLEAENNAGRALSKIEEIYQKAQRAAFLDLAGEALLKLAQLSRVSGLPDKAATTLARFQQLHVENMILQIAFMLESARSAFADRYFDETFEFIDRAERLAIETGCRPLLLDATLLAVRVYHECGRSATVLKKLKKAERLKNSLAQAYPSDKVERYFEGMPLIKEYRRLADRLQGHVVEEESVAPNKKTA